MSRMSAIAVGIPEADLAEIRGAIGVLRAKLAPHRRSLMPQVRQEAPRWATGPRASCRRPTISARGTPSWRRALPLHRPLPDMLFRTATTQDYGSLVSIAA